MTLHLKMPSQNNNLSPRILVIGVGGAGGNIINSMIDSGVESVDFLNVNTDSQQLKHSKVEKTLQLGPSCTLGLGAGADPEKGRKAAEEVIDEIEEYLENCNLVFLTAGMGGGTGTGATPVIAKVAKDKNILTVGVVTKPFEMEGKRTINRAEKGVTEMQKYVDNLIVIPNQNIFHLAKPDTSFTDSLQFANNVLIDGVKSIIDLMVKPGIMNHDFADVKAVMSETGKVHLGTGMSEGDDKINEATEKAISNPLLENNSMSGAKGVLINVTCGEDTSLHDIDLAINRIREESDEDANIIWGVQTDQNYNGKFKISVISTGIDSENYYRNIINNENVKEITNHINETNKDEEIEETPNNLSEINQASFQVDLRLPNKFEQDDLKEEEKILKDEHPEKSNSDKQSFFGRIFGSKKNDPDKNNDIKHEIKLNDDEDSKAEFINEIKEISEEQDQSLESDSKIVIEDENVRFANKNEYENETTNLADSENHIDVDDDLLQIPAFLRRQAN
ncbi:MAG: cell division protein FtsZ [Pseudomonadota bacterium]|nr:cell division protein FtsZ [Pseudomonadota bacterium]